MTEAWDEYIRRMEAENHEAQRKAQTEYRPSEAGRLKAENEQLRLRIECLESELASCRQALAHYVTEFNIQ